jgi:hypothetical protein
MDLRVSGVKRDSGFQSKEFGDSQSFATRQIFCVQLARTRALAGLLEDAFAL